MLPGWSIAKREMILILNVTSEIIWNRKKVSRFLTYPVCNFFKCVNRMWTWNSWQRWPMASLEPIWPRSASGRVSWPSERASRTRSAERGRGRPTPQPWSAPVLSLVASYLLYCCVTDQSKSLQCNNFFFTLFRRRWKRTILCPKSGRTTLRRRCDLLVAPSVTTTFANMRCLLRHCSRAVASAASGTFRMDLIV